MDQPVPPTRPVHADSRDWKRGVMMIAAITCLPLALVAIVRLIVGA